MDNTLAIDTLLALEINDGILPLAALLDYTAGSEAEALATLAPLAHKGFVTLTPDGDTFTIRLTQDGQTLIRAIAEYRSEQIMADSQTLTAAQPVLVA